MFGLPEVGDAVADQWSRPAIHSHIGSDGNGFEFIYAISNKTILDDADEPSNAWGFDNFGLVGLTAGDLTWHDDYQQTTPAMPFAWFSKRVVPGQPPKGAEVAALWDEPVRFGADGLGEEFIYAVTNLDTLPESKYPSNDWLFDQPLTADGLEWHDAQPDLTAAQTHLYRSRRIIHGVPAEGADIPAEWSTPRLIGHYGVEGSDGQDGAGVEYKFTIGPWEEAAFPAGLLPDNASGFDDDDTRTATVAGEEIMRTWTDRAQSVTEEDRYLYRVDRNVPGIPAKGVRRPTARDHPASATIPGTSYHLDYDMLGMASLTSNGGYSFALATGDFFMMPSWDQIKLAKRARLNVTDTGGEDRTDSLSDLGDGSIFVYRLTDDWWIAWNVESAELVETNSQIELTLGTVIGSDSPAQPAVGATQAVEMRFRDADDTGWSDWSAPKIVGVWGNRGLDGTPGFGGKNFRIIYNEQATGETETETGLEDFGHWRGRAPTGAADALEDVDSWADTVLITQLVLNYRDKDNVDQRDALNALELNDLIAIYVDETQWVDHRIVATTPAANSIQFTVVQLENLTPAEPATFPPAGPPPGSGDVTFMLSRAPALSAISTETPYSEHRFQVDKRARIALPTDPPPQAALALVADAEGPYIAGIGELLLVTAAAMGGRAPYRFAWTQTGRATTGGSSGKVGFRNFGQRARYVFDTAGNKTITVTVTDANGATATANATVQVVLGTVALQVAINGPDTIVEGRTAWFTTTSRGTAAFGGGDQWSYSITGDATLETPASNAYAAVQGAAVGSAGGTAALTVTLTRGRTTATATRNITIADAPAVATTPEQIAALPFNPFFYAGDAAAAPEDTLPMRWLRGGDVIAQREVTVRLNPSNPELAQVVNVLRPKADDDEVQIYFDLGQEGPIIHARAIHANSGVEAFGRWVVDVTESSSHKGVWDIGRNYEAFFGPVATLPGFALDARLSNDNRVEQGDIVQRNWDYIPPSEEVRRLLGLSRLPVILQYQTRVAHLSTEDNEPVVADNGPRQSTEWNPISETNSAPQFPPDVGPYVFAIQDGAVSIILPAAIGGTAPRLTRSTRRRRAWRSTRRCAPWPGRRQPLPLPPTTPTRSRTRTARRTRRKSPSKSCRSG